MKLIYNIKYILIIYIMDTYNKYLTLLNINIDTNKTLQECCNDKKIIINNYKNICYNCLK